MRPGSFILFFLAVIATACSSKEESQEPDYDNMVMADEEEWMSDEEKDRKVIAGDLPVPQELIILEPSNLEQEAPSEHLR